LEKLLPKEYRRYGVECFEFTKNRGAHIFVSWLNPVKEQKMAVIGKKAMAVFDDRAQDKLMIYNHRVVWRSGRPEAVADSGSAVSVPQGEPLLEEAKHFSGLHKKQEKRPKNGWQRKRWQY